MQKRYPEYKESGLEWLGEIPIRWQVEKAKWIFFAVSQKNCPDEPLLSVTQEFGVVTRDDLENRVMMPMGELIAFKLVEPGDFVISLRSFQGGLEYSPYRGIVSPAYTVIRPRFRIQHRYFKYLLKSHPFISELQTTVTGIREGKNIGYKEFTEIRLPIPSFEEQNQIASYLDGKVGEIDAFVARKRQLIALLQEQKQAVINRAVTQGLDPHAPRKTIDVDWYQEIPAHWQLKKLGYLTKIGNGSTPSRGNARYWNGGNYPWLNSASVNQGIITEADQFVTSDALSECHLPIVKANSVLVAITGQGKTRGTAALLTFDSTINQHMAYITPITTSLDSKYLFRLLQGMYPYLRHISDEGGTKGALTCEDVKRLKIPVPPLDEQKTIVTHLESEETHFEQAVIRAEQEIELIEAYRTSLIAHAVTGKIDVRSV